jgi:hypothetical protein
MTAAADVNNVVIGTGTTVTIYTTSVKKTYVKKLVSISPAQSSANWAAGPKTTKVVDLLRVEIRFTVNGLIDSADQDNLEGYFTQGGVFNMTWDGASYSVNMDKLEIDKSPKAGEQDEREVTFTAVVGANI